MDRVKRKIYRFAEFELDTGRRMLLHQQTPLKINGKAFDLLALLIENNGQVLEKDEILGKVWEGNFIEENNLTVQISKLRRLLNETKDNPKFLKTISGRGYCFTANVADITEPAPQFEEYPSLIEKQSIEQDNQDKELDKSPNNKVLIISLLIIAAILSLLFAIYFGRNRDAVKAEPFQNLQTQRLTSLSRIQDSTISPDGKFFAYVLSESKGQSLWLQQLGSAQALPLIPPMNVRYWGLNFTPDSNEIYYSVFSENNPDIVLFRISILGGFVKEVKTDVGSYAAFSPDGQKFAYITSIAALEKTFLKIAKSDGTDEKTLVERESATGFEIAGNTVSWSPDGNLIAAIVKEANDSGESHKIIGFNPNSGEIQNITDKSWVKIKDVMWLKDNSGLIITASESSANPLQIWHIKYPSSEATQITTDLESYENLSVANDNSILAVKVSQTGSLLIGNESGEIEKSQTIATQSGGFKDFVWTTDKTIAFISNADGVSNIWQLNADGTDKKQLTKDAQVSRQIDFSVNGNYFVFDSARNGKANLWQADAAGNNLRQLTKGEGESFPSVSKDGSFIIYQNGSVYGKAGIWKINADGTNIKEIRANSGMRPQLSPDGKQVAFFFIDSVSKTDSRWKIGVASIESGEIPQKIDIPPTTVQRFLRWTNDGKAIAYIDDKGDESSIIIQPLNQSNPFVKFKAASGTIEGFAWSNDGKQLVVNSLIEIRDAVLIRNK